MDAMTGSSPLRARRTADAGASAVGAIPVSERKHAAQNGRITEPAEPGPEQVGDAILLARMANGERDAHRQLYERHAAPVLRYLIGRLDGDRALAEEVLQEVMLAAWQGAASFRGASRVSTWLFGIAHHRAANLVRKRRREIPSEDPAILAATAQSTDRGESAGRLQDRVDRRLDLEQALLALPESQRAALELVFYHGLSVIEAAEVLSVAPGTIKSRLFRAKATLRDRLALEEGSEHA
ncbi:MAG: RNA polymerase sigma factor [Caldilineae bacterium]|nr:RNA polymerase sigma factor [Caldilineae bacterium]